MSEKSNYSLFIHHHDIAYVDHDNAIWLSAGIAKWVTEFANHFDNVYLLFYQSLDKRIKQDTPLQSKNVHLLSIGENKGFFNFLTDYKKIREIYKQFSKDSKNILLIRGITQRQLLVWKNFKCEKKAFYLVREPHQNRLTSISLNNIISEVVNNIKEKQFSYMINKETKLFVNSPQFVEKLSKKYNQKVEFISSNVIKRSEIPPLNIRNLHTPVRLLFVGRIHYLKGIRELIVSLKELIEIGIKIQLDLVGQYNQSLFDDMQKKAENLNVDSLITWYGQVPYNKKLMDLYQNSDIFVLPSYTEGFPRVLWEAAINSCPIITTNIGGIPALFENDKQACLIPPKTSNKLTFAIQKVIQNNQYRENLIREAYKTSVNYCLEDNIKKFSHLLKDEIEVIGGI